MAFLLEEYLAGKWSHVCPGFAYDLDRCASPALKAAELMRSLRARPARSSIRITAAPYQARANSEKDKLEERTWMRSRDAML